MTGTTSRRCSYRQDCLDLVLRDESQKIRRRYVTPQERFRNSQTLQASTIDKSLERKPCAALTNWRYTPNGISSGVTLQAGSNILLAKFEHGVYYQYLPAIYSSFPTSKLLVVAVETVGLRCLSLARNEIGLLVKAREHHAIALRTAKQQVSDLAIQTISDQTHGVGPYHIVAAVLLLALFAVMSSDSSTAREVWTKHVDGALAILVTWQFESKSLLVTTPAMQNLLGHVINCVQVSYLQQRRRLPETLDMLYDHLPEQNIQKRLHGAINGLADVPANITKSVGDALTCLKRLQKLDDDLSSTLALLGNSHPFKVRSSPMSRPNGPICHEYPSHRSAQVWNLVRILKLKLNEQLLNLLTSMSQSCENQRDTGIWTPLDLQRLWRQAFSAISSLTFDIYASVPPWLRGRDYLDDGRSDVLANQNPDTLHWAHSSIWPLATIKSCPYTSEKLLVLINETLRSLWQATTFPGAVGPEKQQVSDLKMKDWYV